MGWEVITTKIPGRLFSVDIEKVILKFIRNGKITRKKMERILKEILERTYLPNFQTDTATLIKVVWFWCIDRNTDQQKSTESPERDLAKCPTDFWARCKSNSVEEERPLQQMVLEWLDIKKKRMAINLSVTQWPRNPIPGHSARKDENKSKKIHAPQSSWHYYSQEPRLGSKINIQPQANR